MNVNPGSKISNLMGYALKKFKNPDLKQVTWNGSGTAIHKVVSCAEIMKRRIRGLYQITKVRFRRMEEFWEPTIEGLERLKVNRDVPAITILLSKSPLDEREPGYQAPGNFDTFWKRSVQAEWKAKKYSEKGESNATKKSAGKHTNKDHPEHYNSTSGMKKQLKKSRRYPDPKDNKSKDQASTKLEKNDQNTETMDTTNTEGKSKGVK